MTRNIEQGYHQPVTSYEILEEKFYEAVELAKAFKEANGPNQYADLLLWADTHITKLERELEMLKEFKGMYKDLLE
jgi:hypothetical protein